jgi:hypothetical protein
MPTTRTANLSALLYPGLHKVFFNEYKGILTKTEYDKIFNIETSTQNYEKVYEMTMLGGSIPEVGEGEQITYVDPVGGNTVTFTHKKWGRGFAITEEAYEDDLYRTIGPNATKALAKASSNTIEVQAASVLNNATSTTYYTGFDSKALASTSHTVLFTGGTYANRPATLGALGITTLQAAVLRIEKCPDQDGVIAGLRAKLIVIPPDLRFLAHELLKSEYKPFSANNEVNALASEGLSYFVSHYLSSTTFWCVLADKHNLKFFWRRKPRFDPSDDFATGNALFKVTQRHIQGFGDWRGFDLGNT